MPVSRLGWIVAFRGERGSYNFAQGELQFGGIVAFRGERGSYNDALNKLTSKQL